MNRANKLKKESYYNLINTINKRIKESCSIGKVSVSAIAPYTFLEDISKHFVNEGFVVKPHSNYDEGCLVTIE